MNAEYVLTAWTFRPLAILVIIALAVLYRRGWAAYRQRPAAGFTPDNSIDSPRTSNPSLFALSLVILSLGLLSPLHYLAGQFFFMRVTQHLFLISLFPALFMHANPIPVLVHGLPKRTWTALQSRLDANAHLGEFVRKVTPKSLMWFLFVACVWLWYDKTLHALTLEMPWTRNVEIATLVTAALFHWWHITGAAPKIHKKLPSLAHIGYTLAGSAPLKIPGLILLLSLTASYDYPATHFLGWQIDPLTSQRIGGALVWMLGGVVYSTTALAFMARWIRLEEEKPPQPRTVWDSPEKMIAPGMEKYL